MFSGLIESLLQRLVLLFALLLQLQSAIELRVKSIEIGLQRDDLFFKLEFMFLATLEEGVFVDAYSTLGFEVVLNLPLLGLQTHLETLKGLTFTLVTLGTLLGQE